MHQLSHMIMQRLLLSAAVLLISGWVVSADAQVVRGQVRDAGTQEGLPGATIRVQGTELGAATDLSGFFSLDMPQQGSLTLEARHIGYTPEYRVVEATDDFFLLIDLSPVATELTEILVEQVSLMGGPQGVEGLPGSAHYLGTRAIQRFGGANIHSVLREVPGIVVQEEDGYGLRPNIGIRGTGSERSSKITLMEDGVLMAPAAYTAPAAYYFPNVGRMEGVELRKGSSQIEFGPNTTGGALNLRSMSIPSQSAHFLELTTGSNQHLRAHAWTGNDFGRFAYLAQAYVSHDDGFKQLDGGGTTGFAVRDFVGKLRYATPSGARVPQQFLLKLSSSDERSNETYLGLTESDFSASPLRRYAGSAEDEMNADHRHAMLRHIMKPTDGLSVVSTIYATRFHRNWYKLDRVRSVESTVKIAALLDAPDVYPSAFAAVTGTDASALLDVKANNRTYRTRGIQTGFSLERGAVKVEGGVRLHYDEMDRFQWVDAYQMSGAEMHLVAPGAPGTDSNRIERSQALASHLQLSLRRGRWMFTPGFRTESIRQSRDDYGKSDPERNGDALKYRENRSRVLLPGMGMSYRLTAGTQAFAGLHRGFSPPGTTEGAHPELSVNAEVGIRHEKGPNSLESVVFLTRYSNLLGSDLAASGGLGSTDLFNGGEARAAGLELSGSTNAGALVGWRVSLPVRLSYTLTEARFLSDFSSSFEAWGDVRHGDQLPYMPRHRVSGTIGLDSGDWSFAVSGAWTGWMRTRVGSGTPSPSQRVDARLVVDMVAEKQVRPGVRMYVSVRNVTDAVYVVARRPAGLRPGLPRTMMLGVRATL